MIQCLGPAASIRQALLVGVAALLASAVSGQDAPALKAVAYAEPTDESGKYQAQTLAEGLNHPQSIVLRPGTPGGAPSELFLSESGAGRVVCLGTDKPSELSPVVVDIPVKRLGGHSEELGPLGLEFITPKKLAVGTGGLGMGQDVVRVYTLPADGTTVTFEAADHAAGPIAPSPRDPVGAGVFLSLAKIDDQVEKALFVAAAGEPQQGWLLKGKLSANRVADLQPFIATRKLTGVASPSALAINPKPRAHYLLVAQAGERTSARDSSLGFYGPASGTLAMNLQTGLYDISALAYSPSGDLYAADFAWHDPQAGGVYRLEAAEVDGLQACRAVKIASLVRPAGLAFTPDGALYVTAFGDGGDDRPGPAGSLLKITPREGAPPL